MADPLDPILKVYEFKDDGGRPIVWTAGQREIMRAILFREYGGKQRVQIETPTRYGKSSCVGAALSIRASTKTEPWAIIAGTEDKARIIMDYVIKYSTENQIIRSQLNLTGNSIDRLARERSKTRLTYLKGGVIRVFSGDAANEQKQGDSLMGFGSPNVIEDEAALIPDPIHAKVIRMLGNNPTNNFLCKIGNPFHLNHFKRSHESPRYAVLRITADQAVSEGRLTEDYLRELRQDMPLDLYRILYDVEFPELDQKLGDDWYPIFTTQDLKDATLYGTPPFGEGRLGVDVAGAGRNYCCVVYRSANYAKILYYRHEPNPMKFAQAVVELSRRYDVPAYNIFIDTVGARGFAELVEQLLVTTSAVYGGDRPSVHRVVAGEKAGDAEQFYNLRAEMYWRIREWLKAGGKLAAQEPFQQLINMSYRVKGDRRLQVIPKEIMLRFGIESPDAADALSLTFATSPSVDNYGVGKISRAFTPKSTLATSDPYGRPA